MLVALSRPALALTVVAAVGLHAGVGLWFLAPGGPRGATGDGTPSIGPITLVQIGDATAREPLPLAPPVPVQRTPDQRTAVPAHPPPQLIQETQRPQALTTTEQNGEALGGNSDLFVAAALPGEPLIPLGDEDAAIPGSISLRLAIDETGRVVESEVVARQGLSDNAVAVFVRAFSSYEYIPARRGGRTVRSEVTMVVGVKDSASEPGQP